MPVVATAGHVDHGKSALIEALTGRDPDRLEEEKRRGLTIDLGFAWMDLPSGSQVSFVDVPGHRRFIGNMLTGVGPVDVVLLVVAANEGWMPQTEEHLAVLDLLGVTRGVVAITKADLVEGSTVSHLIEEIGKRLVGTSLETAQILPVSVVTGQGLGELINSLDDLLRPGLDRGRPRLWVDRVFTVSGAGTVVTGTLRGGELGLGDSLAVWPSGHTARIRGLEKNDAPAERVGPTERVAVNLAGVVEVGRGSLLSKPGFQVLSSRCLVDLRSARYEDGLIERGAFLVYLGTFSGAAQVRQIGEGLALIQLKQEIPVEAGDRLILRETGRQRVTGGGVVLMPSPPRKGLGEAGMALRAALPDGADKVATVMLSQLRRADIDHLVAVSGGGQPEGLIAGGVAVDLDEAERLGVGAAEAVEIFHRQHPLEPGMAIGALARELAIPDDLVRSIIAHHGGLDVRGSLVSATDREELGHEVLAPSWEATEEQLRTLTPPTIAEVGISGDALKALLRAGKVLRVSDDFIYLEESIAEVVAIVRSFEAPFSVSEFRSRAGVSRKYAIPLLEYTDREGITLRQGDLRTARR